MSDRVESIAFDQSAPQDERVDALTELQASHAPSSYSDLVPSEEIQEVIDHINQGYEEAAFAKAMNASVVPFPSKAAKENKAGMQSVMLDDWAISVQGDYWDRPSALGFDSMRAMVEQTPILNAIVLTRIRQAQRFCGIAESNANQPGFEIRHVDRKHELTDSEQKDIQQLNRFFSNCGWEFNPRRRKALRRDSFSQFVAKVVRDSLTMDSVGIETEWKRNKKLGIDGFYAVDGSTIRLCTEQGYRGDDEVFAVQVVAGTIRTAYTFQDLIYEPRNPRADVRACGYGLSETELLIRVVTGFLNAMTYNIKGFDSNSIPKGMLHLTGNYSKSDLNAFKRYWNSMVKGINNAWTLPVMVSKDSESKASFENFGVEYNEMYFSKWMTFLTSISCAIYGMSPAEINFDSFTGGSTSALSGSDTAEKLAASKDSGLRPLLSYFESVFTDYIVSEYSDNFVFRWTGLDPDDADKKHELKKMVLTVDEIRAEEGYQKHEDPDIGNAPVNQTLMGVYMNKMQAAQGGDPESGEGQDGQGDFGAQGGAGGPDFGDAGEGFGKSFQNDVLSAKNWWEQ